jgi:putative endonuclease
MANQARTLYVGSTSDLPGRVVQDRSGAIPGFTRKYGLRNLVYFESTSDPYSAVTRERRIKRWHRKWKIELIDGCNPTWRDLAADILSG